MSALVICYPPSGGGNHFKNLLCLDRSFNNSGDLETDVYQPGKPEVQSPPRRNVYELYLEQACDPNKRYVLHGHFGELAPYRELIQKIPNTQFLVFTVNDKNDQILLERRQRRLGQGTGNPWYLTDEQPFLYNANMMRCYFNAQEDKIMSISIFELWHPDLNNFSIIPKLSNFFNVNIDQSRAQELHSIWFNNNFMFDFCHIERKLYGKNND